MRRSVVRLVLAAALLVPNAWAQKEKPALKRHPGMYLVGSRPVSLELADLTGDGRPEIITANRGLLTNPKEKSPGKNDEVSVLVAGDDFAYSATTPLNSGFAPYDVEAVNVDGQRALDLVVTSFMPRRGRDLSLFRNFGENRFEPFYFSAASEAHEYFRHRNTDNEPLFTVPGFTSVAVARLDGDEFRDAVATGWSSDVLAYFKGNAETYLDAPVFIDAPGGPFDVQIADMDRDGDQDLVTTLFSLGEVAIWLGDGEGNFEVVKQFPTGGKIPHRVRIADIDRNGHRDLVVSHKYTDDNVVVWFGGEDLRFDFMVKLEAGVDSNQLEHDIRDIAVGDFDANGRLDVAAACPVSRSCVVWLQEQRVGASPSFRREDYTFKETEGEPYALAARDVDGDGDTDLGVALWRSNTVTFLLSTASDE